MHNNWFLLQLLPDTLLAIRLLEQEFHEFPMLDDLGKIPPLHW